MRRGNKEQKIVGRVRRRTIAIKQQEKEMKNRIKGRIRRITDDKQLEEMKSGGQKEKQRRKTEEN